MTAAIAAIIPPSLPIIDPRRRSGPLAGTGHGPGQFGGTGPLEGMGHCPDPVGGPGSFGGTGPVGGRGCVVSRGGRSSVVPSSAVLRKRPLIDYLAPSG